MKNPSFGSMLLKNILICTSSQRVYSFKVLILFFFGKEYLTLILVISTELLSFKCVPELETKFQRTCSQRPFLEKVTINTEKIRTTTLFTNFNINDFFSLQLF